MKEKSILFSGEMVRAILSGQKTMTRRIIIRSFIPEPTRILRWKDDLWAPESNSGRMFINASWQPFKCKYGQPGDRLWVRETWAPKSGKIIAHNSIIQYRADDKPLEWSKKWHPSIHMPRWASRITLEIADIRIQRLQEITDDDILAEGCPKFGKVGIPTYGDHAINPWPYEKHSERRWWQSLWNSINEEREYGWDKNPFVFVISFKVCD